MKTFKHAMGDAVFLGVDVEGVVVGRCEYSEDYEPGVPRGETHLYCIRTVVNGDYVWNWHPESEVRDTL